MRNTLRMLLVVVCILTLPMWLGTTSNSASQFIAVAGHVSVGGRYCSCNNPETCSGGQNLRIDDSEPQDDAQQNGTDNSTELGIALLILTFWLKLRA